MHKGVFIFFGNLDNLAMDLLFCKALADAEIQLVWNCLQKWGENEHLPNRVSYKVPIIIYYTTSVLADFLCSDIQTDIAVIEKER